MVILQAPKLAVRSNPSKGTDCSAQNWETVRRFCRDLRLAVPAETGYTEARSTVTSSLIHSRESAFLGRVGDQPRNPLQEIEECVTRLTLDLDLRKYRILERQACSTGAMVEIESFLPE